MRREELTLTVGPACTVLTVIITGTEAQIQHARKAIIVAASEAKDMEAEEQKPCGCSGS